jgi:hypothetical protein
MAEYTWQNLKLPMGCSHWIGPSGKMYRPDANGRALIVETKDRLALLFSEEGQAREIAAAVGVSI